MKKNISFKRITDEYELRRFCLLIFATIIFSILFISVVYFEQNDEGQISYTLLDIDEGSVTCNYIYEIELDDDYVLSDYEGTLNFGNDAQTSLSLLTFPRDRSFFEEGTQYILFPIADECSNINHFEATLTFRDVFGEESELVIRWNSNKE